MTDAKQPKRFNPYARSKARRYALQALYQWDLSGNDLTTVENNMLAHMELKKTEVPYFSELLHQIPNHLTEIDAKIQPVLDRAFTDLTPIELALLRLGVYELLFRPDIPFKVVINEAVELAKTFGAADSHKYINGVLDKIAPTIRIL